LNYVVLNQQQFYYSDFKLVPIRYEDRYDIKKWRNEQLYHLRQTKPLTKEDQDKYFNEVISKLFDQEQPDQLLFSFLEKEICIGYGGLVHINWIDKNAEISFIMNTALEKDHFQQYWSIYLELIEKVGFQHLNLHKLYVYAFDLRPHLYNTLEGNDYFFDASLKEHCRFGGNFIDVVIYSKINPS
jgi:RimJ/RimL family protein N-acetyltransferase